VRMNLLLLGILIFVFPSPPRFSSSPLVWEY
jgi:hypothetical protein